MTINKYLTERKNMFSALLAVTSFLDRQSYEFSNISTVIFSINNILYSKGYRLADPDGNFHTKVYCGDGSDDIHIVDNTNTMIGSKLRVGWKMLENGLGWKISVKLI